MVAPHERADWPFLQCSPKTLFLESKNILQAIQTLEKIGYHVCQIDCSSDASFLTSVVRELKWDAQFGYCPDELNLEALNDAVRSEPFDTADDTVVVLNEFQKLWDRDERQGFHVLDIFTSASRDYLLFGKRLLTFVHVSDPRFETQKLGALPTWWNGREWFHKDRGI